VQSFNTPRGTIRVSTPEATAFDLVGYADQLGGLDQVAMVLGELGEALDPDKLAAVADALPEYIGAHLASVARPLLSHGADRPSQARRRSAD